MELIESDIQCPYCGESVSILVEPIEDEQQYVEDCHVCCAPILIRTHDQAGSLLYLYAEKENA
ncbi:MAG: CPXCG motif-containing cysteine-rich protein [Agarilytica sp.]